MGSLIPPLNSQVEIVDENGKPTPYFTRLLTKLTSAGIAGTGLTSNGTQIALATQAAKTILANKTSGTASPTACTISDILDFVSATRGTILYRGTSGWAALAPGTAGYLLQTNGAGADPTWVVAPTGGGGGATAMWEWGFAGVASPLSVVGSTTAALGAGSVTLALQTPTKMNLFWFTAGQSSKSVTFDFGVAVTLSGMMTFQDIIGSQGTWQPQYSDDNITFSNIGTAGTWGGAIVSVWGFTNSTAHRYWRLTQTSGTTSSTPWQQGLMFRWGAA
jgi:hypothetical protein